MVAWIAHQKYLIDNGMSFVSMLVGIFNTSMLLILASDKIKFVTNPRRRKMLLAGAASFYLLGAWTVGKIMDASGYLIFINDAANARNKMLQQAAQRK